MKEWHDILAFFLEEWLKIRWTIVKKESEDSEVGKQKNAEKNVHDQSILWLILGCEEPNERHKNHSDASIDENLRKEFGFRLRNLGYRVIAFGNWTCINDKIWNNHKDEGLNLHYRMNWFKCHWDFHSIIDTSEIYESYSNRESSWYRENVLGLCLNLV